MMYAQWLIYKSYENFNNAQKLFPESTQVQLLQYRYLIQTL